MMLWMAWLLASEPVVEDLGGGRINWTSLELEAEIVGEAAGGLGDFDATEGQARSRLGPRMLELARKVRLDGEETAEDVLGRRDAVADAVDGNLALWEVEEATYYASGRVGLTAALPLEKWLRPAFVARAVAREQATPSGTGPSGLVIDARGLSVKPSMAPRLVGPDGAVLYEAASMTAAAATQRSPTVWVTDPADVHAVRRAGEAPLFVRAAAVVDGYDVGVSAEDAARIAEVAAQWPILRHGAVVMVVSP